VRSPPEGAPFSMQRDPFTSSDAAYTVGHSYLAGTHEEALFRGWLLPLVMEKWNSKVWANIFVASVFGLAHLSGDNPLPLPQLILGWHLGYVAQKRGMTLGESIFIHTWWDIVAFASSYQYRQVNASAAAPILWLPPLDMAF